MDSNPDSVYNTLICFSDKLSNRDYPLYCFMLVQSMDKTHRTIDTDTLINIAIDYYKDNPDSAFLSQVYYYAGRVYEEMQNYPKSINYYLKSIDYIAATTDWYDAFLSCYYLGNIYSRQELFEEALSIQKKAYHFAKLNGDSAVVGQALYSLSFAYQDLGKNDSALYCLNHIDADSDSCLMASVYNNIANIYYNDSSYDVALKYIHHSIALQNDSEELCYNDVLLGRIYLGKFESDSAIIHFKRSMLTDNLYTNITSCLGLGEAYELKKEYNKAATYYKEAMAYKDSLEKRERRTEVIRLNKIYQYEQIKEENYALKLSESRRKQMIYSLVSLLFLSIVLFVWIYYRMKLRREAKLKRRMIALNEEKSKCQQLEFEHLKSEKSLLEIREQEAQLRDAFFLRLNSLCFPFLNNSVSDSHRIKISKQNWEDITSNVNSVFNKFTVRLRDMYPLLSEEDVHFCCLLKMRLPLDVLMQIYCIQKQSIYKKKERIKKEKMGIDDNRILDDIICSL